MSETSTQSQASSLTSDQLAAVRQAITDALDPVVTRTSALETSMRDTLLSVSEAVKNAMGPIVSQANAIEAQLAAAKTAISSLAAEVTDLKNAPQAVGLSPDAAEDLETTLLRMGWLRELGTMLTKLFPHETTQLALAIKKSDPLPSQAVALPGEPTTTEIMALLQQLLAREGAPRAAA
jgi:hypothetical protein